MASTVTSTNNLSLRSILEKDKLTGSNFLDWERNLMIVLRHERKWYVLEEPLGEAPPANAPAAARNAHKKHSDDLLDVACLMLATMSPDLQTGLINTNAYDMIRQLRDMFQTQARTERYDATKAFNECKMVKGTSVSDHVMKMKRHLDHLERLGHPVPLQLATDTILNSLSQDYRPFVVNYNMNNMEKTIAELHSMLKTAELNMGNKNKTKDVLMVKDGGVKKKNGHASTSKGKGPVQAIQSAPKKGKGKGRGKKVKPNKARTENRCFICNEIGHWRQNCPKRHEAGRNHSSTQQLRKVAVYIFRNWKLVQLEDNNFKRGQSEQTLSILTQHAKKNPFYKAKPDLGLSVNHVLDKAPSHLYNFEDMAASKPKPAIVGGHVTEEFVRQTVRYTEVINGIKARTPRVAMPPINYTDLNSSYDTREMELSEETLVIPPEDTSATKCPDLVRLEKEVFTLRLKAMDLDACQHQILNLKVIVSEKDSLVRNLEKDLLEANAERIRLSSECETATSAFTDFQIKVADLQARYVILDIHFELLKELDHDERIMYRQSLTNQRISNSILKRKVMNLENLFFSNSVDDKTAPILNHPIVTPQPKPVLDTEDYYSIISDDDEPPNSHHRIAEPKTVQDPNVEYDMKVFLDEDDDPSGFIPKKPKSVVVKSEQSTESRAPISEKSNPEVGETSQLQPNQPFSSTKPKFSKKSSGKGGNSIPTKPSSNSHHAYHADARRKDGGPNVKPPRKDHHGRNNSFSAFPKKHSPSRAGLGYVPPSVGKNSNMSVNSNRNLNDAFNTFRNDMCFMFDNFLRYGVSNSFYAPNSNVNSRKRRGRKRGKAKSSTSVKSPQPKEKSEKGTTPTDLSVSNPQEPIWQWVPKQA
ncbi:hypothetical protein OSB04_006714 [Centaurea solstitialis]|uniref:CCHC-type domain-containing protein n=1 Tax=Centaurea solstitialis TaxID=347529 RepID=A0AA38TIH3_9ASTR|nr:hypothetical protein OSB04_006714 [Centaurea solstitialis]